MEATILEHVESMRPRIVETCRELVQINTVNPYSGDPRAAGEKAGQEYLQPRLDALGARTHLFQPPDDIYDRMKVIGPKGRDFTDRPNLVGELEYGDGGPTIVINGHMDTVGAADMSCDPFAAELRGDQIWGRGPSDCKGGLTVGLCALEALSELDVDLKGKVIFQSVVDEECNGSGAGTIACVDAGYVGDTAIFLDGNDSALTVGCYGCLTADVLVTGQEGHAAYGTGVSALEKALIVKQAIDDFGAERLRARPDCRLNIGVFQSGVHPAVVPGKGSMSLNMVYHYDEAMEAERSGQPFGGGLIRSAFEQSVAAADQSDEWLREHASQVEWVKDLVPFAVPENAPAVARLGQVWSDITGAAPTFNHMIGWSDACYYAHHARMPTILFGPGKTGCAHSPDEHVEIESLVTVCKVLTVFLARELGA
ncbi:MAG: M20/M25/M40 family metallo-hydrolase [Armatimonadota bacterium]|jgi:acetylornithine deacetylase